MASKGKAEKVTEAVLGGDGSPYAARVDGRDPKSGFRQLFHYYTTFFAV